MTYRPRERLPVGVFTWHNGKLTADRRDFESFNPDVVELEVVSTAAHGSRRFVLSCRVWRHGRVTSWHFVPDGPAVHTKEVVVTND